MPNIEISSITVPINGIPTELTFKGSGGSGSGGAYARSLTYEQYQALSQAEKSDNDAIFFISDAPAVEPDYSLRKIELTQRFTKTDYYTAGDTHNVDRIFDSTGGILTYTDEYGVDHIVDFDDDKCICCINISYDGDPVDLSSWRYFYDGYVFPVLSDSVHHYSYCPIKFRYVVGDSHGANVIDSPWYNFIKVYSDAYAPPSLA